MPAMRARGASIAGRRGYVVAEFTPRDAHDLGRFLSDFGHRENDHVWEDGEQLIRAAHEATGGCPDPKDCPMPGAMP